MKKEKILELYENYIDDIYSSTMNEDKLKLSKEISDLTDKFYLTLTKEQEKILKELQEKEDKKQELVYEKCFCICIFFRNRAIHRRIRKWKND